MEEYLQAIELELGKTHFPAQPKNLYEPIDYFLSLGGKRSRPALLLAACNLFTQQYNKAMPAAVAIEFFHNFTLMHDDIMDKSPLRRGKATVHEAYNTNIAILSGDVLLVKAYSLLSNYEGDLLQKNYARVQ